MMLCCAVLSFQVCEMDGETLKVTNFRAWLMIVIESAWDAVTSESAMVP